MHLLKLIKVFLLFIITVHSFSQDKFCVYFNDKKGCSFDPYEYFDAKAIDRRIREGISLYDITDFPVNEQYVKALLPYSDSVIYISRWLNAAIIYAKSEKIEHVKKLPFVLHVEELPLLFNNLCSEKYDSTLSVEKTELLSGQLKSMGGQHFTSNGFDGSGIRIAIFDAGFPTVDKNPAFSKIREEKRIIKTFDFVTKKENVYGHNHHGLMVMSCIGGKIGNQQIGLATGAEFLLARTERSKLEPYSEEENWLAAAEWADKNGAHIINSSLGYTYHRYYTQQMDGKHSLVAKAANMAARKGILVVNAAGNDGSNNWHFIGTPADADSVLAVGGINNETMYHTSFSSFGPTADLRLKPNICAFGHVIAADKSKLTQTQGTSFASPLVAGFAACAWQARKDLKCMELFKELERAGHLYPYYDYAHGYGIPQASYFIPGTDDIPTPPSFDIKVDNGILSVLINEEYFSNDRHLTDKDNYFPDHFYYHIYDKKGILSKYSVIAVYDRNILKINLDDIPAGNSLRFHFKGYTQQYIKP